MLAEIIHDMLEGLGAAALDAALVETIHHEGPPARYLMIDLSERVVLGFNVEDGDDVRVYRGHRLLIEPIASVMLRPLPEVAKRWEVH